MDFLVSHDDILAFPLENRSGSHTAPFTGEAVSVANWGLTGISATRYLDGRRRKNLSAVCPRIAGELLWFFKYALKRSKPCLRHPFNYRELSNSLRSYPQRRDLFFFIFIILSLFYVFYVIDFN